MTTKVGRTCISAKGGHVFSILILQTYSHNNVSPTRQTNLYEFKENSVFLNPDKSEVFSLKAPNFGRGNPLLESV